VVITNAAPVNAYRGAGRPDAAYLIERLIDHAAATLALDPIALRRRNAVPAASMPYRTPTGSVFDSGDFPRLLAIAERESDWQDFPARRAASARAGKLRGIGCALFLEPSGGGAVPKDQVAVHFADGSVRAYIAPRSNGQGHETVFADLIADWLGIDPAMVEIRAGDPDGPRPVGGGSFGSRSLMTQGSVLKIASDDIIRKGLALAADLLEANAADIAFAAGIYTVAGTDRAITMTEIIRHPAAPALDTTADLQVPRAFPSAAHVAEIEIDPDTGTLEVLAYIVADDIGRVVNATLADGQLRGGIMQGAGQALCEHCVYDQASGQLLTGSFMDYAMPHAGLIPAPRITHASVPSPNNPIGAKGVGESGTVGAAPTLMNAVANALTAAGHAAIDMPASPHRIWAAIHT
jgi:carbon-monoxide dehydrogenase large subunit